MHLQINILANSFFAPTLYVYTKAWDCLASVLIISISPIIN